MSSSRRTVSHRLSGSVHRISASLSFLFYVTIHIFLHSGVGCCLPPASQVNTLTSSPVARILSCTLASFRRQWRAWEEERKPSKLLMDGFLMGCVCNVYARMRARIQLYVHVWWRGTPQMTWHWDEWFKPRDDSSKWWFDTGSMQLECVIWRQEFET